MSTKLTQLLNSADHCFVLLLCALPCFCALLLFFDFVHCFGALCFLERRRRSGAGSGEERRRTASSLPLPESQTLMVYLADPE